MYNKNNDIGWKVKDSGGGNSEGSYDDTLIKNQITSLNNKINNINSQLEDKADLDDVPTKTSQLINDSNYITETYIKNQLNELMDILNELTLRIEVLENGESVLPEEPNEQINFSYNGNNEEVTITGTTITYNAENEELIISGLSMEEE